MCITETHLNSEVVDAEIMIDNYTIFRKDRDNGREKGGSLIYVSNSICATNIENFNAPDSLAISLDLPLCSLIVVCVYRAQSLSQTENYKIMDQISKLQVTENTEIVIVGDFNMPNVSWDKGSVECSINTTNKIMLMQKSFMDLFQNKGFHPVLADDTVTRRQLYNGELQESHPDQILTSDPAIIGGVDIVSAMGKSDHLGIICSMRLQNEVGYIRSVKDNWSNYSTDDIKKCGNNINWDFSDPSLSVEELWCEFHTKLNIVTSNVPKSSIKVSKNGALICKLPWDYTGLKRIRKIKDKAWKTFTECLTFLLELT